MYDNIINNDFKLSDLTLTFNPGLVGQIYSSYLFNNNLQIGLGFGLYNCTIEFNKEDNFLYSTNNLTHENIDCRIDVGQRFQYKLFTTKPYLGLILRPFITDNVHLTNTRNETNNNVTFRIISSESNGLPLHLTIGNDLRFYPKRRFFFRLSTSLNYRMMDWNFVDKKINQLYPSTLERYHTNKHRWAFVFGFGLGWQLGKNLN